MKDMLGLLFEKRARRLQPLWAVVQIRSAASRKKTLPNQTPVFLALALALKFSPGAAHPSAAFRADPIQNAGNHVLGRFDTVKLTERHIRLANHK
jgi:hypothetical protein